jgi:homoserine O-acetyltransferase
MNVSVEPVVHSYALGDFELASGNVLLDAQLTYATYGKLSEDRSNLVVIPTFVGGTHSDTAWMIGPRRPLDPERWFIVIPNQFGSGLSTSPSNVRGTRPGPFPRITIADNVRAQRRLVADEFGGAKVALVAGVSMGALQAYEWATQEPDAVERLLVIAGCARTSPHTWLFLEGMRRTLLLGQELQDGWFRQPPVANLEVLAWAWAGWTHSQAFINRTGVVELGYESLQDYYVDWVAGVSQSDADDLMLQLDAWRNHDIAAGADDLIGALKSVRARTILMPIAHDLYFPPEDSACEVVHLPNAELRVMPGDYGHVATMGFFPEPVAFVDAALADLLAQ